MDASLETNEAYCRMLGYSESELLELRVEEIECDTDWQVARLRNMDLIRQQGQALFESQHRGKDGDWLDVEVSASFLNIREGALIAFVRDISERKRAEQQIRQLAYYDTLTGLPNRRLMMDRFEYAFRQAKRYQRSMAIMYLDLDNFKQINDTLGHDAGDDLLQQVAVRLTSCLRAGDSVARPGGDEFVILLPEISQPEDARLVADKVIEAFADPVLLSAQEYGITTSIGIAIFPVNGSDDIGALMKKADVAMYEAKAAGRNRYQFFQE